ncbi:hypothetical protein [Actinorugispora endophytica]|uniref:Uncharacterized protein n=1 Tax=Actinorugispora endophytica TaxID=1605990 RepID=A0A4R6V473_9ACTN|nr:hypothetical protein [Actinorugispora endophytica]TDQ53435.1 hypothetical protein EV190_104225 [Actinorugispora endophytica]
MSILQPGTKRIRLSVPADSVFDIVRDLDGASAEVAETRHRYRYLRDDVSVDFEATGGTVDDGGKAVEVFQAVRVNG